MARAFADIAFTPEVRALQDRDGSAAGYARFLAPDAPPADALGPDEVDFLSAANGAYQASVASNGWPYVQFRGGPRGFLKTLDAKTIGYADLRGNRQHLSAGNIAHDGRISLFVMDYAARRRLKIWGEAEQIAPEDDPDLAARLAPGPRARIQRLVRITVRAFDWNCPAHIPQRFDSDAITILTDRIEALSTQNALLRAAQS
jgi:predicted pyridoxine 5'-phosphate oxidase superfamily flavin-nucleotide-binding protein